MYSFQKLTQFSHVNNVLDDPACNMDGLLLIETCVLSTLLIGLFRTKTVYLHLEKPKWHEVLLSETNLVLKGNQFPRCCSFKHGWICLMSNMLFFNSEE
jgi:hypothetical protein